MSGSQQSRHGVADLLFCPRLAPGSVRGVAVVGRRWPKNISTPVSERVGAGVASSSATPFYRGWCGAGREMMGLVIDAGRNGEAEPSRKRKVGAARRGRSCARVGFGYVMCVLVSPIWILRFFSHRPRKFFATGVGPGKILAPSFLLRRKARQTSVISAGIITEVEYGIMYS